MKGIAKLRVVPHRASMAAFAGTCIVLFGLGLPLTAAASGVPNLGRVVPLVGGPLLATVLFLPHLMTALFGGFAVDERGIEGRDRWARAVMGSWDQVMRIHYRPGGNLDIDVAVADGSRRRRRRLTANARGFDGLVELAAFLLKHPPARTKLTGDAVEAAQNTLAAYGRLED